MQNKKGVSLVAVLLFMLVATIAGTATYKLIGSVQSSSASRLKQTESYRAAMAGLDAARSWMTYHANDVGAAIRQFKVNNYKPVKLNDVLASFNSSKQSYSVWLTGAETSSIPYKLKLVSIGTGRDGSTYGQVAILKVGGLYQVKIPEESSSLSFNQAFAGKIGNITGKNTVQSGLINGDLNGNTPNIEQTLLVTGNVSYQGGTSHGADVYVKGDFSNQGATTIGDVDASGACDASKDTNAIYIGGDLAQCAGGKFRICGDLFVNGNISAECELDISGNLTVNGIFYRSGNHSVKIGRNLVFTENATLDINGDNFGSFEVTRNLYMPKKVEGHCTNQWGYSCGDGNGNRQIKVGEKVYVYEGTTYHVLLKQTGSNPVGFGVFAQGTTQEQINNNENDRKGRRIFSYFINNYTNATDAYESQMMVKWDSTDDVLKNVGNKYWDRIRKMSLYGNLIGDDGLVPQPLLLKDSTQWLGKIANDNKTNQNACIAAGYPVPYNDGLSNNNIKAINNCYKALTDNSPTDLYNGFMIVKIKNSQLNDASVELDGKIILYFDEKPSQMRIPPTKSDAVVMLYFDKGAGTIQKGGTGSYYRYFVYSNGNISTVLDGLDVQGGMIMANNSKFEDLNNGSFHYEKEVVEALANAGIVKENPEFTKRANPSSGGSSTTSTTSSSKGVKDEYFISTTPQLNITLEAQYKNKELKPEKLKADEYTSISPSIIVLPRVIYITKDAVGKLEDYYNIINLNNSKKAKDPLKAECSPTLNITAPLYDGQNPIEGGIYNCKYNDGDDEIPFWVRVSGEKGVIPNVHFEEPGWASLDAGGSPVPINLVIPQSTGSNTMSVTVRVSGKPDSWNLIPQSGVSLHSIGSSVDGDLYFTAVFKAIDAKKTLFIVSAPANAEHATVNFELVTPLSGCNIGGGPDAYAVSISGSATINRADIPSTYCSDNSTLTSKSGAQYNCSDVTSSSWPSCTDSMQTGIWVYPYCNSLITTSENKSWTCGTNYSIHYLEGAISSYCEAFIPDTSLQAENEQEYTLYASLKRKPYKLLVKTTGVSGSTSVEVTAKKSSDSDPSVLSPIGTENGYKVYQVYANYSVNINAKDYGENRFNYWKCTSSGEDCIQRESYNNPLFSNLLITANDTLTAVFNERDKHCFYDSFDKTKNSKNVEETFQIFCPNNTYENCVDHCSSGNHCSIGEEGTVYPGSDPEANWMLIYANKIACSEKRKGIFGTEYCVKYGYVGYEKPIMKDGLIRAPGTLGNLAGIIDYYKPTMLLHRVKAGFNGKMSLKMKTPVDATEIFENAIGEGDNYNDGMVLRSDVTGSSYLSVNLYKGYLASDGNLGAQVRVCYVEGVDNTGSDCIDKPLKNFVNGNYVPLKSLTDVTMNATLQGSSLTIDFDYNTAIINSGSHRAGSVTFDLTELQNKSLAYSAVGHEYIGLKMFNTFYFYKDISWTSQSYSNECFATPQIYCSFANKYLGGTVPESTDVVPWVGVSSWFLENSSDCGTIDYYYNGCDMSNSYFSDRQTYYQGNSYSCSYNSIGWFWTAGDKLKDSIYNFQDKGYHKIDTTQVFNWWTGHQLSGYAKNASVQITCGSTTYSSSCGRFYVGKIQACTKHEKNFEQAVSCTSDPCYVTQNADASPANLRDAKLSFTISGLTDRINVRLVDKNNVVSDSVDITSDGDHEISVALFASKLGFDPQNVISVKFSGSTGYTVSNLQSICDNAPGVSQCRATFNGSGFEINSTIKHSINAASGGCSVSEKNNYVTGSSQDCPADGKFYIDLTSSPDQDVSYTFTITMTDKENVTTSCTTDSITVKKPTLTCWVENNEIYAGEGWPSFKYYIKNCPSGGCKATVELVGKTTPDSIVYNKVCSDTNSTCDYLNWAPSNVNSAKGEYKYQLKYSTQYCDATVKVIEGTQAKAENCRIEGTDFKADITGPSTGSVNATLRYTDPLGNPIGSSQTFSTGTGTFTQSLSDIPAGSYVLGLFLGSTEPACTMSYTATGSSSTSNNITCGVSTHNYGISGESSFIKGTQLYFMGQNKENNSEQPTVTLYKGETSLGTATLAQRSGFTILSDLGTNLDVGSYSFYAKIGDEVVCSHNISIEKQSYLANCNVEPEKVILGNKVKFTANSFSPNNKNATVKLNLGTSRTIETTGNFWLGNTFTKQDIETTDCGSFTFYLYVDETLACEKTFTVVEPAPSFSCSKKVSNGSITITPSDVTGCSNGCRYTIAGTSTYGDGYKGGNLPSFSGNGSSYEVSLTNGTGTTTKKCADVTLSTTPVSYNPGSYTMVTEELGYGPHTFGCSVSSNTSEARTIGTINNCTLTISAWNTASNKCQLYDNSEYTFTVDQSAPAVQCSLTY